MSFSRLLLVFLGLAAAPAVFAGTFDYYTLAVSLTPAYCDQNPKWRDSLQCRDRLSFTVHGLWPENAGGRAPANCAGPRLQLSTAQENDLRGVIPDGGLRQHEWKKHGSCSGLEPAAYFALLSHEFRQLKWPAQLQAQGRDATVERALVLREFRRLNPGFPERGVVLRCEGRDRPPLLSEIRVCLTPAGEPTECAANFKPNCPVAVKIRAR